MTTQTPPENAQTNPLASPCMRICKINPATGLCLGCYRRREEIKAWKTLDEGRARALLETLATRRAAVVGDR